MTITWSQDIYNQTWHFAAEAHQGQTIPGSPLPYIVHLSSVAMEVIATLSVETVSQPNLSLQCALLHDVIEDTSVPYNAIADQFGIQVADGVQALSKNDQLPDKQSQMVDSLARIKKQPPEVWLVKMADRITNLQGPPAHWSKEKISLYREEGQLIWNELQTASPFLATRLQQKIDDYKQYL
ncbi:MAG: HD domain-containing protein [Chloroflexota bacterium]